MTSSVSTGSYPGKQGSLIATVLHFGSVLNGAPGGIFTTMLRIQMKVNRTKPMLHKV
jgi:hypothetical protein